MSLINPVFLYGLAFASIPVILHLLLKAKPKRLPFPALQLIKPRKTHNVRRLRLRHIWLLLLRIAIIALIVLALARPSLPAANYSLNSRETATLVGLIALAAAAYAGIVYYWRRAGVAKHELRYRSSLLKAGVGSALAALFLLLVGLPYGRRLAGELTSPQRNLAEQLPVACVYVFDTSPSMDYRRENKSRLDAAKEIAREHRSQLPAHSRVAVADSSSDSPIPFQADPAGAQERIDKLEVRPISIPLNRRIRTAFKLHEEDYRRTANLETSVPADQRTDRFVREIYLFTDLAKTAWQTDLGSELAAALEEMPSVGVYLIDVGVAKPENVGITDITLPRQTVVLGADLSLEASVEATGIDERNQVVELHLHGDSGELIKQGQSNVTVRPGSARRVPFSVSGLTSRIVQGEVRLLSSDPLSIDDVRYFTAELRPPPDILVVSDSPLRALYFSEALAPEELVRKGRANYRCDTIAPDQLLEADVNDYEVVCLLSVRELSPENWRKLEGYVDEGGGLAVFLGSHDLNVVSYNDAAAQSVLPAKLDVYSRLRPPQTIDLTGRMHPLLQGLSDPRYAAELGSVPVHRFWKVDPMRDGTVIAPYTDAELSPALVDRAVGKGRVVMVTTAASSVEWNELPRSWSYLAFADRLMQYLTRQGDGSFNYIAGEPVLVRLDPAHPFDGYLLRKPQLEQRPGKVPPGQTFFTIEDADQVGHYDVVPQKGGVDFRAGFSVNPSPGESNFTRLTEDDLDLLLGEGRYSMARDVDGLVKNVQMGRMGREVYPLLLCLMIIVFCAEHIVANRFYQEQGREVGSGESRRGTSPATVN